MKPLICSRCGSPNLVKHGDIYVCENCETKFVTDTANGSVISGTVKFDNTEKIANLFRISRRARDEGNYESAEKYYDMLLQEKPDSWEASFFVVYCRAMQTNLAGVSTALSHVRKNMTSTLELLKTADYSQDECKAASYDIFSSIIHMCDTMCAAVQEHYKEFVRVEGATKDLVDGLSEVSKLLYSSGDQFFEAYGSTPYIRKLAVKLWKKGVEVHKGYLRFLVSKKQDTNVIAHYEKAITDAESTYSKEAEGKGTQSKHAKARKRKGMIVCCIIFLSLAVLFAILSIATQTWSMLSMPAVFVVLGIMSFVLVHSPKNKPCIFGKSTGIKRSAFVFLCIVFAFVIAGTVGALLGDANGSADKERTDSTLNSKLGEDGSTTNPEISAVSWHESQMPAVSQSLLEYAQSAYGIPDISITESKFRFSEQDGWTDCHYVMYFDCTADNESCIGEARAFLEYGKDKPEWFHFEVFRKSDGESIREFYDESYDQKMESQYNNIVNQ